jgi:hypothetical protein
MKNLTPKSALNMDLMKGRDLMMYNTSEVSNLKKQDYRRKRAESALIKTIK